MKNILIPHYIIHLIIIALFSIFNSCAEDNDKITIKELSEISDEWILINQIREDSTFFPAFTFPTSFPLKLKIEPNRYSIDICGVTNSNTGNVEFSDSTINFSLGFILDHARPEWENEFENQLNSFENYEIINDTLILKSKTKEFKLIKSDEFDLNDFKDRLPSLEFLIPSC